MKKRIVVPITTLEILLQFGDIDTVLDDILSLVENGDISTELSSAHTTCQPCKKITVNITNQWFIDLVNDGQPISLVKLLQYFVDNELYNEFNWQPKQFNVTQDKFASLIEQAQDNIIKAISIRPDRALQLAQAHRRLADILKEVQNERVLQD